MSNRSYPRYGEAHQCRVTKKTREPQCLQCGKDLKPGDVYMALDLQYTYMRGEDDVIKLCTGCNGKRMPVAHAIGKLYPGAAGADTSYREGDDHA